MRSILLLATLAASLSSCVKPSISARQPAGAQPSEVVAALQSAPAQAAAEAEVLRVVARLFDGMRAGDSSMVRSAFDSSARLVTTMVRNGVPTMSTGSVDDFVRAVGTPHTEVWDERISHEVVQIDGPLATVWMRYRFFAGTQFSHCDVNAFELFRRADGWRITSIADTRRRDNCDPTGE